MRWSRPRDPDGPLAYRAIYLAAIVEGEIVFVAASVLVASGQLHYLAVLVAGALGAATGDQLYFYGLRGRWKAGWRAVRPVASRRETSSSRACAVTRSGWSSPSASPPGSASPSPPPAPTRKVPPLRFSALNLAAAFVWATLLLALVSRIGPAVLATPA